MNTSVSANGGVTGPATSFAGQGSRMPRIPFESRQAGRRIDLITWHSDVIGLDAAYHTGTSNSCILEEDRPDI
jgi:hypothetical protein